MSSPRWATLRTAIPILGLVLTLAWLVPGNAAAQYNPAAAGMSPPGMSSPGSAMNPNAPTPGRPQKRSERTSSADMPEVVRAPNPTAPMVIDVKVEGNETRSVDQIRPYVKTRRGRPLDRPLVDEDARRLHASRMFLDVNPVITEVPGGVVLTFQVVERPSLKYIRYVGNEKVKARTLNKQVGLKRGDAADPFAVEEAAQRLESWYREKGHTKVVVKVAEGDKLGDRGAVFVIHEGPIQKVDSVNFIGNTIAPDGRMKQIVQTKPPILHIPHLISGFKGFVDRQKIDDDIDRLTAYYRDLGYFQAVVSRQVEYDNDQKWADVTYVINEGPRYRIRNISYVGYTKLTEAQIRDGLDLKPGDPFDRSKLNSDVTYIEEKYGGRGYVFAKVEPETKFHEEPGELDLVVKISEGYRARVGQINVTIGGEDPHTRRMTVLNRLSVRPNDILDLRELRDSERRLRASGIFLADPSQGEPPKIVFSPPESEDGEVYAERPRQRGVRGQSPDAGAPASPTPGPTQQPAPMAQRATAARPVQPPPAATAPVPVAPAQVAPPREPQPVKLPRTGTPAPTAPMPSLPRLPRVFAPAPAATPAGSAIETIRGQSPASQGLKWQSPATASTPAPPREARYRHLPIAGRASDDRSGTVVRGQDPIGEPGYATDQMPSFSTAPAVPRNYPPSRVVPQTAPAPAMAPAAPPATNPRYAPAQPTQPVYQQAPAVQTQPTYQSQPAYGSQPAFQPQPVYQPGAQPLPSPVPNGTGGYPPYGPAAGQPMAPGAGQPQGYGTPGELLPDVPPADDSRWLEEPTVEVPLDVQVDETQTGRLMFGVGVNSNAGLIGSITLDEQNFDWRRFPRSWNDIRTAQAFRGGGQHLRIEALPGTQLQRYMASFTEPYLFDSQVSLGLSGYFYTRIFSDWYEQRLGGRVTFGRQLAPDLTAAIALRAEDVGIFNPVVPTPSAIERTLGHNALYSVRPTLTHDTRDSPFMPTSGHRVMFAFEQAFGSFSFPRGELEASQYFLLKQRADGTGRHTLSLITMFGVTGTDTPMFENFFAGGFGTLRGFYFRGASPRQDGSIIGGRFQFINTVEYMFPIKADDALRGVAFVDFGTVAPVVEWKNEYWRIAPGVGLRISLPAMGPAPIALDFAVPVMAAQGDQRQLFNFSVGIAR